MCVSWEDAVRDGDDASAMEEHRRSPANHQKLGERHGADSPSQPSEGTSAPDALTWTSSLQNFETLHFCCWGHSVGDGNPSKLTRGTEEFEDMQCGSWLSVLIKEKLASDNQWRGGEMPQRCVRYYIHNDRYVKKHIVWLKIMHYDLLNSLNSKQLISLLYCYSINISMYDMLRSIG